MVGAAGSSSFETEATSAGATATSSLNRSGDRGRHRQQPLPTWGWPLPPPQNAGAGHNSSAPAHQLRDRRDPGHEHRHLAVRGQTVTTQGVVTADYATGGFNGFFLETGGAGGADAETTPGASDAVFVFGSVSAAARSRVGESVQVTGEVTEFQGETEIGAPDGDQARRPRCPSPRAAIPWSDLATDAAKEAHEGELIAPQGDFTVSDNFDANFFGSFTLAAGDTRCGSRPTPATAGSAEAKAAGGRQRRPDGRPSTTARA